MNRNMLAFIVAIIFVAHSAFAQKATSRSMSSEPLAKSLLWEISEKTWKRRLTCLVPST